MPAKNPLLNCPGCVDSHQRQVLALEAQCVACRKKERHRLWRAANPGASAQAAKAWRAAGNKTIRPEGYAEAHRQREKRRYHETPDVQDRAKAAASRQRSRLGKEVLRAQHKAWRLQNPGKAREYYLRQVAKMDPALRKKKGQEHRERYRAQRQAGQAAYYARRYGGDGVISNEHLYALHKWQDHCCFYCRVNLSGAETIEHVVPLSRGGSNNPWNVVLACADCNNKKNNKIYMLEWQPERIEKPSHFHSVYGLSQLKKMLKSQGIVFCEESDHLKIQERRAYILSSFWLGWQGDSYIKALKAADPTAIIFFDKEFARRPDAIVNVLKAKAGIADRRMARRLRLEVPTTQEAQAFISRWHAMGGMSGTFYLGLRDDVDWWAIAAFRRDVDRYEVARMAIRETVAGGVSRIISHFQAAMPETMPISAFTDQRMGDGKSHFFAGFDGDGFTERSFFYATPESTGFHARRDFQKQVLEEKAEYFDPGATQVVLAKANGLMRVEGLPRLRFTLNPPAPYTA